MTARLPVLMKGAQLTGESSAVPLSASNRQTSTRVAFFEKSAKLTPWSVHVAPKGRGVPACMRFTMPAR